MSGLMVKLVDVLGDTIMAAKDNKNVIWVGINSFCQGLDMDKKQRDWQVEKIKQDKTLLKGCRLLPAGVFDAANEVYALRLDFVPIWLAKISITKRMEKDHPELADKLLKYQLQAKDILATAFLPKKPQLPQTPMELLELHYKAIKQVDGKAEKALTGVEELKEQFNAFEKSLPLLPNEADQVSNTLKKRVVEVLGGKTANAYKNRSLCQKVFMDAYRELKRNFNVTRYKDIKREQLGAALEVVSSYTPPVFLAELITAENAQMKLDDQV